MSKRPVLAAILDDSIDCPFSAGLSIWSKRLGWILDYCCGIQMQIDHDGRDRDIGCDGRRRSRHGRHQLADGKSED